jgi:hypothetical protein
MISFHLTNEADEAHHIASLPRPSLGKHIDKNSWRIAWYSKFLGAKLGTLSENDEDDDDGSSSHQVVVISSYHFGGTM